MNKKKFVSLLCASAMMFSTMSSLVVAQADTIDSDASISLAAVEQPSTIENVPALISELKSVEGNVATFEVKITGVGDKSVGAISYAVSSSDSEVTVSEIETADSFRAATTNVTTNGVSMLSWSDSNGVAGDSNVIGTYTATVNGDIVDGTEYALTVGYLSTAFIDDPFKTYEYDPEVADDATRTLNYNIPTFKVSTAVSTPEATAEATPEATAEATPEATAEATPEATATVAPTTRPRPTYVPEATATPEVTPTSDPGATAKPSARPTSAPPTTIENVPSLVSELKSVEGNVATFELKITGVGDKSVGAISYAVSSSDDGVTVSEIAAVDSFSGATTNVTDSGVSMLSWSDSNGVAGDSNVIGTYTVTVSKSLDYTQTYELTLGYLSTAFIDDPFKTYEYDPEAADDTSRTLNYNIPSFTIEYVEPTTEPGTPEPTGTPAPTEKPIVGTPVKVTDIVDTDKAAEYEAQEDVSAVYVSVVVTDTEGNELEYGEDYVVKDAEGNILTQNEFNGLIGGHLGNVSEALDGLSIVAYRDDVKVNAQLIAEKADGSQELVDVKDEVVADPSTTPTTAPSTQYKFTKWTKTGSSSSITSDSITRGYSRTYVANFNNFDEDTQYIKYEITSGDRYIDLVELADTTKINVEASTVGTARIKATLYDEATDKVLAESTTLSISVKSATSSSGSSSSSGSGSTGGSSIGQIAGGNLGNVSITDPGIVNGNVNFQDLDQAAWARDAIVYLAQRGIINGRSSTEFAPNDSITRAEFAQLVINMYGLNKITSANVNVTSNFADVQSGTWYYNAVNIAANLGIVNGYPDGNFYPNNLVSRQEMALMMYRVANKANAKLTAVNEQKVWSDPVADWAADAVTTLQMAGVINGTSDTTFEAEAGATRAQAAQMIYNLYQVIK